MEELAPYAVGICGLLAGLGMWLRGRGSLAEANAKVAVENEKQESIVQAHLLARLTSMDTRLAQLDDTNRLQASQIRDLERTNRLQADQISGLNATLTELGADKARLAQRVIELEREVDAANRRALDLKRELEGSLELAKPSTLSERPPRS